MLKDTNIEEIKDELVRRILSLERFRDMPMSVEDESVILDILKILASRIIALEKIK